MASPAPVRSPADDLRRVMYLLDRALAPSQKIRAFSKAADLVDELGDEAIAVHVRAGTLEDLPGIGSSTGQVITDAVRGDDARYVNRLEGETEIALPDGARPYRDALRGDCHSHSLWSDGGASIEAMARTAIDLGHDYLVLTDHSPRLTVAHGLDRDRLVAQLEEVDRVNAELAPFRILTGIEVDIFEDGTLDQDTDLLARLDIVVASAHSKLKMEANDMTKRLVMAVANPHVDILGHCTGRKLKPTRTKSGVPTLGTSEVVRAQSQFDAEVVFAACAQFDTAVEINCRPERQDPPDELLELALEWECKVSIDTDAHAPGQLEWQTYGCEKAAAHEIPLDQIVNTWAADDLLSWAAAHQTA